MRSRRPKKAAKADFRPNWADSGLPFGLTFGQILPFFEGLHFRQILGSKFRRVGGRIWPPFRPNLRFFEGLHLRSIFRTLLVGAGGRG